jgi:TRAP-type C4-dicarboxylate transport system permease small subunit
MNRLSDFLGRLADIGGHVSGALVPIMVLLVAFEVFMRYVLQDPPMVADEFSAYMLVALSYLGLAYTWRKGGHVRITLLVSSLPVKIAGYLRLFTLLLIFSFMVTMTYKGYGMIRYALEINLRSDTWLTFPLVYPQITVAVGFLMLTLILPAEIIKAWQKIQAGEPVEERL